MNMMSEQTNEIFAALAKAQGKLSVAQNNKVNPHFKSKFADLQAYFTACRGPLSENNLAVIQTLEEIEGKSYLVTTLGHSSGQWIKSRMPITPTKNDMQGFGSALSYSKRYSLGAIIGLPSGEEDDDGNDASTPNGKISSQQLEEFMKHFYECDVKFQQKIMDTLKQPPHNAKSLADMPANIFDRVFESVKTHLEKKEDKKSA